MFQREVIEVVPSGVRCCTILSPAVFLDCGHPRFWKFNSIIPIDVIRVKSYVDSFLDPTGVPVRVSINKLYLDPKWIMAGLVGVLRNSRGLGTGESYFPAVLFDLPVSPV